MSVLPEFIGTVHIILGPYRGNPIGLYLRQEGETCRIAPTVYPWSRIMGTGETTNKAAADFEAKWKQGGLADEMYTGPHWEGGIKPEKPKPPPKPAAPPKPNPEIAEQPTTQSADSLQSGDSPETAGDGSQSGLPTPAAQPTVEATAPDASSTPPS